MLKIKLLLTLSVLVFSYVALNQLYLRFFNNNETQLETSMTKSSIGDFGVNKRPQSFSRNQTIIQVEDVIGIEKNYHRNQYPTQEVESGKTEIIMLNQGIKINN